MTENDVNPPIHNDPMEKRNEFIDHPSYLNVFFGQQIKIEYLWHEIP